MNIEIKKVDFESDKQDIEQVWKSCNWGWNEKDPKRMESVFKNRWKNFVAYLEDEPVGYVGLISDHNVYALIVDMMVNPVQQKKGIGKAFKYLQWGTFWVFGIVLFFGHKIGHQHQAQAQ